MKTRKREIKTQKEKEVYKVEGERERRVYEGGKEREGGVQD